VRVTEAHKNPLSRRLFFALCPGDELRSVLKRRLRKTLPRGAGRLVPVENLHITLVFLGQVGVSEMDSVSRTGDAVACPPFRLVLDTWPKPRVLWLGPQHTPAELFALVGSLRSNLQQSSIVLDQRPYQAHMTLMRKVSRPPTACAIEALEWHVERFSLMMESVPEDKGVRYHQIQSWPLK